MAHFTFHFISLHKYYNNISQLKARMSVNHNQPPHSLWAEFYSPGLTELGREERHVVAGQREMYIATLVVETTIRRHIPIRMGVHFSLFNCSF